MSLMTGLGGPPLRVRLCFGPAGALRVALALAAAEVSGFLGFENSFHRLRGASVCPVCLTLKR